MKKLIIGIAIVALAVVCLATAAPVAGQAKSTESADTTDNVQQVVQDFVDTSGESVTALQIVSFLNKGIDERFSGSSTIAYGSEYIFNSAMTFDVSAAVLSDTKFVVVYQDAGNSSYGTAVIGDVSGTTITYGSEYVFNPASIGYNSVVALSDTKFVVAYQDAGNSDYGTAVIGNVSGNTISFGSEYVFNPDDTWYISADVLTDSKFVVAYDDSGYGTAVIGNVSGTIITYGSEYIFNSAGSNYISAAALSGTRFMAAYNDYGNSNYGTAVIGNVSGSAISYGSEYVFNPANTWYISAEALTSAKFVVAYSNFSNPNYGTAVIGNVSGSTISYGSEYVFNPADTRYISTTALSDTEFMLAYQDHGNSDFGTALIGDVSDTTISYGSEKIYNPAGTYDISANALSTTKFAVAYSDISNSYYGTAVIGDILPPTPTPTSTPSATPTVSPTATPTQTVQVWLESPAKADRCSSFSATVNISQVENFDSASYDICYDSELLNVTAVNDGSIDANTIPVTAWGFIPEGIQGAVRIINNVGGASGVTGNGTLAVIDFDVDCYNCGNTTINFCGEHVLYSNKSQEIHSNWSGDSVSIPCPP